MAILYGGRRPRSKSQKAGDVISRMLGAGLGARDAVAKQKQEAAERELERRYKEAQIQKMTTPETPRPVESENPDDLRWRKARADEAELDVAAKKNPTPKEPTPAELREQERYNWWLKNRDKPDTPTPRTPDAAAQDLEAILANPDWLVPVVRGANEWAGTEDHLLKINELLREEGFTDPEIRNGILGYILDPDTYTRLGGKGAPPQRMGGIGGGGDALESLDETLRRLEAELASPE